MPPQREMSMLHTSQALPSTQADFRDPVYQFDESDSDEYVDEEDTQTQDDGRKRKRQSHVSSDASKVVADSEGEVETDADDDIEIDDLLQSSGRDQLKELLKQITARSLPTGMSADDLSDEDITNMELFEIEVLPRTPRLKLHPSNAFWTKLADLDTPPEFDAIWRKSYRFARHWRDPSKLEASRVQQVKQYFDEQRVMMSSRLREALK